VRSIGNLGSAEGLEQQLGGGRDRVRRRRTRREVDRGLRTFALRSSRGRPGGADKLSVANVAVQLDNLRTFACVRKAENERRLELSGLWFDIGGAAARLVLERDPYLVRADEALATV
jgi:carbonic anhydrase